MKLPSLCWLICIASSALSTTKLQAGLAEATDFDGPWTHGTAAGPATGTNSLFWRQTTSPSYTLDGIDAVMGSLGGGNDGRSWMETTVTGPATLYFSYRIEDMRSDYGASLSLMVDGSFQQRLAYVETLGASRPQTPKAWQWQEVALPLEAGSHTVRWEWATRRGDLAGSAYVDQVWTSNDDRPRITETHLTATFRAPLQWTVPVHSKSPALLSSATLPPGLSLSEDRLSITGTPTQVGTFDCFVTAENEAGKHVAPFLIKVLPSPSTIPEGIDMPGQGFTQGAAQAWSGIAGFGVDGTDCVKGGAFPVDESTMHSAALTTTLEGPGTLSFWCWTEFRWMGFGSSVHAYVGNLIWPPPLEPSEFTESVSTFDQWQKFSLEIPPGMQTVSFVPGGSELEPGEDPLCVYIDGMTFDSRVADIRVIRSESGQEVNDGGAETFGSVRVGASTSRDFTIRNAKSGRLTGLGTTIEGPDASSFSLVTAPVGPINGLDEKTSFSIRFAPVGTGTRTATLRIESNDPDENPFEIVLAGCGTTIVSPPASQVVAVGERVVLSVGSSALGATYQWRKDGRDIRGAVGANWELPSANPWDSGEYTVVVTSAAGIEESRPASVRLGGVPEGIWRGLVSYYPFDGETTDMVRASYSAELVNGASLLTDPVRGGVASINGKGFVVPPLPSEDPGLRGPGGFIRIPRPIEARGESFTISFWVKERGYSSWHGESYLTLGVGEAAPALVGHYWVGGLEGQLDHYGANGTLILETVPTGTAVVAPGGGAVISQPMWRDWTVVGAGGMVRFYSQGVLKGSLAYPAAVSGDVFLGRHWWVDGGLRYSTRFQGEIDEVRFYNRALTEEEVRQLSVATRPVPPPNAYDTWAQVNGLAGAAAGLGDDPDGDGWTNSDEYVFGTHPRITTPDVARIRASGPGGVLEWIGHRDAQFALARSLDLRVWSSLGTPVVPAPDQSGVPAAYQRMQVTLPPPLSNGAPPFQVARVEGVMAPFLADAGRLESEPASGEPLVGSEVVLGPASGLPWEAYEWLKDGVVLPGASQPALRFPSVQKEHSGLYQLVVTSALGTALSQGTYLRVSSPAVASVKTVSHATPDPGRVTVVGLLVDDGGLPVLERGIVFGSTADPTVDNGVVITAGSGPGFFEATAAGVVPGAPLLARAFALTALGVAYGESLSVGLP